MKVKITKPAELADGMSKTVLLWGEPGTGKTTIGAMCERPVIILTERNGAQSIADANPDADVIFVSDYNEYTKAVEYVRDEIESGESNWKWLVVDSFSEMQSMLIKQRLAESGKDHKTPSMDEGQVIVSDTVHCFDNLQSITGINKLVLCTFDKFKDDKDQMHFGPAMYGRGSAAIKIAHKSDVVGRTVSSRVKTEDGKGKTRFAVFIMGKKNNVMKGNNHLDRMETPVIDDWLEKMKLPVPASAFSEYDKGGLKPKQKKKMSKKQGIKNKKEGK